MQELDVWEKTQGGQAPNPSSLNLGSSVMRKDFDAVAWSSSHEDDFRKLIANARRKVLSNDRTPTSASDPGLEHRISGESVCRRTTLVDNNHSLSAPQNPIVDLTDQSLGREEGDGRARLEPERSQGISLEDVAA